MKQINLVILTILALFSPAGAATQDFPQAWHWLIVTPDEQKNWLVEQGEPASVSVKGEEFSASLNDGSVLLKGTITGNRVTAMETLVGTDAAPMLFHGDVERLRTRLSDPSNGWGSDRISLTAAGGFQIGLFRNVRSGAPPGK